MTGQYNDTATPELWTAQVGSIYIVVNGRTSVTTGGGAVLGSACEAIM